MSQRYIDSNYFKYLIDQLSDPYTGFSNVSAFGMYTGMGLVIINESTGNLSVIPIDGTVPELQIKSPVPVEDPIGP